MRLVKGVASRMMWRGGQQAKACTLRGNDTRVKLLRVGKMREMRGGVGREEHGGEDVRLTTVRRHAFLKVSSDQAGMTLRRPQGAELSPASQ